MAYTYIGTRPRSRRSRNDKREGISTEKLILNTCQYNYILPHTRKPLRSIVKSKLKFSGAQTVRRLHSHSTSKTLPAEQIHKGFGQQLFDSVISPAMMYGEGTWTTTEAMRRHMRTKQKNMIRIVIYCKKRKRKMNTKKKNYKTKEVHTMKKTNKDHQMKERINIKPSFKGRQQGKDRQCRGRQDRIHQEKHEEGGKQNE